MQFILSKPVLIKEFIDEWMVEFFYVFHVFRIMYWCYLQQLKYLSDYLNCDIPSLFSMTFDFHFPHSKVRPQFVSSEHKIYNIMAKRITSCVALFSNLPCLSSRTLRSQHGSPAVAELTLHSSLVQQTDLTDALPSSNRLQLLQRPQKYMNEL